MSKRRIFLLSLKQVNLGRSSKMRILHTVDWHLGKIVNEFSMLDLQEEYLDHLMDEIEELNIDAVIMAGDLYDRALPPKESVSLANHVFTKITQELKIPMLVIAGNHDSNERIEYGSELFSTGNLFIEGTTKEQIRKVKIKDTNFYLLPYDDPRNIRQVLNNDTIRTPEDALKAQLEVIAEGWNEEELNVLLYHGFVMNTKTGELPEESESERPLTIGTVEYVPVELLERFDYVALGHLHKAQKVKSEQVRYSGSPLKYSKSEANHKKQHLVVELSKEGVQVDPIAIKMSKDLRVVRGFFEEILKESSNDYIFFELEDTAYVVDAMNQLRKHYPNAMGLEYVNQKKHEQLKLYHSKENIKKLRLDELFGDFYEEHIGMPLNEEHQTAVMQVLEEVRKEGNTK